MKGLVAPLLLALPFSANAGLIQLEYEAVVDSVGGGDCDCVSGFTPDHPEYMGYSVGDRLRGVLSINLALAPPDRVPLDPTHGHYPAPASSAGFISGNGPPRHNLVFQDGISISDQSDDDPLEQYYLTDQWRLPRGSAEMRINIFTQDPGLDLIRGDSLEQDFEARAGEGVDMWGYIYKSIKTAAGMVSVKADLLFDRIKVSSPGRCSM